MKKSQLVSIAKEAYTEYKSTGKINELDWSRKDLMESDRLEWEYATVNELNTDPLNSYEYTEESNNTYTKSYSFTDRCGNTIVAAYIGAISEIKTGYRVPNVDTLVFQPERLKDPSLVNHVQMIKDWQQYITYW
jgi:hypothetical protein